MEKNILQEILKSCNWYEKIIVKIFKKVFIKISEETRIRIVNSILK